VHKVLSTVVALCLPSVALLPWVALDFPNVVLPVILSVVLGVSAVAGSCLCLIAAYNRTEVRAAPGRLTVSTGPIPGGASTELSTEDLAQIVTKPMGDNMSGYRVVAIRKDGTEAHLLAHRTQEGAWFLEQELEDWLGLEDALHPGAVRRPT
jgi:hypothetical protein